MALQVWLPLTKDLRNQGLANVTVTNYGATLDNSGKLGKCYYFDGTDDRITVSGLSLPNVWSYSCWIYSAASSRSWEAIIMLNSTGGDSDLQLGFYTYPGGNRIQNTANGQYNSSITWTYGVWHHFCGTFDGSNLKTYIDGILVNTKAITASLLSRTNLTIGARSTNAANTTANTFFQGKLNDVRIYDHCLSPMEVKELAKGLVLHYPLNRQGWGQENLLPCGGTYIKTSPWTTTLNRTDGYAWVTNSAFEGTPGETYTVSVECDGNLYSSHGGTHNATDKHWTFWLYVCNIDTTKSWSTGSYDAAINLNSNNNNYRKIGNTHVWTVTLSNTQKYISVRTNSYSDGSTNLTINWWNMKIEKGSQFTGWCPNNSSTLATTMGLNGTTEYDCSGFCNNGTRTGTFTWTSDTPKYNVSQYFEDYTRYISCFMGDSWIPDVITMSCWIKGTNHNARGGYHLPLNMHTTNFEISITGSSGKARMGFVVGGTRYVSDIGSDILNGNWHMLTLIYNGSQICRYIDGILVNSENRTGALTSASTLGVGQFPGATTYGNTQLYESDVRIYATALSADDVLSLYQNSAYIDNNGNVYGAIHTEV